MNGTDEHERLLHKHPAKWAERQLRSIGFTKVKPNPTARSTRAADYYEGTNHPRVVIRNGCTADQAKAIIYGVRSALGIARAVSATPPVINRRKVKVTVHARERLALMREQAAVGGPEIEAALLYPASVRWSPEHGSWVYTLGRISAAVAVDADGTATVKTFLWSRPELFDQHPRPEKEAAA